MLRLFSGHVPVRRHVATVEAAAAVIGEFGPPIGRQAQLFVERIGTKPRQAVRSLDTSRGEVLGGPKRRPRDTGIKHGDFREADRVGLRRKLWA